MFLLRAGLAGTALFHGHACEHSVNVAAAATPRLLATRVTRTRTAHPDRSEEEEEDEKGVDDGSAVGVVAKSRKAKGRYRD